MPRLAIAGLTLIVIAACDRGSTVDPAEPSLDFELRYQLVLSRVEPMRPPLRQDPAVVDLGRALFFDKILSGNRDVSCATCHDPRTATGDGRSLSIGTGAIAQGSTRVLGTGRHYIPRNAPALFNLANVPDLFWDARIAVIQGQLRSPAGAALPLGIGSPLAAQALLPVANRGEMRGNPGDRDVFGNLNELARFDDAQLTEIWDALMRRLVAIDDYVAKFSAAYPDIPVSQLGFHHAANALAAFQVQALTFSDSPFDRYLAGQNDALSSDEKRGALLFFTGRRCSACHFGPALGSRTFAATATPQLGPGVGSDAPLDRGMGRFMFRVPPLRNVELTAPYMHAGAYATLEAVVRHYGDVATAARSYDATQLEPQLRSAYHGDPATIDEQLGGLDGRLRQPFNFDEQEIAHLVSFLRSLTDPAARDLRALVPPSVPSGLPVR